MVLVSYDIADDKKRAKFAKYLRKFGYRLQYSVWEITNSSRILDNIVNDIDNKFAKEFDESDSIYIFQLSQSCNIQKFGYASHEDDEFLIVK